MPRPKRSSLTLAPLEGQRPAVSQETTSRLARMQAAEHLRCPVCGLQARKDLIANGPYALEARTEFFGAREIIWTAPEDPSPMEMALVRSKVEEALALLRTANHPETPTKPLPSPSPAAGIGSLQIAQGKSRSSAAKATHPIMGQVAPAAVDFPPFELLEHPTKPGTRKLIAHLHRLAGFDIDLPQVNAELERLEDELQNWVDELAEKISREEDKEDPNEERVERLQEQHDTLEEAVTALGDRDIGEAITALEPKRA